MKTTTYIPYSKLQDYNTPNKKKNESSKNLERDASHEEASLKTIHDYGRLTKLGFHCLALSDMPPSAAQTFNEKNPRLAPKAYGTAAWEMIGARTFDVPGTSFISRWGN